MMPTHNPNPFDFVSFSDAPFLDTPEAYELHGELLSGYLDVELTALTPVHVVGYQRQGNGAGDSFMYRHADQPCIPAASIRGCLRAFTEALTAGWVSQANEGYPKDYGKRHVGFNTFTPYTDPHHKTESPAAIEPSFKPQKRDDGKIDVASYLFGMVTEQNNGEQSQPGAAARKSKVWIEDALIRPEYLESGRYWIPNIAGDAFMGGPKPSASNWWYFQPDEIWDRYTNGRHVAEFIGSYFWGRKFYYHQDPVRCIRYYDPRVQRRADESHWSYHPRRRFAPVYIECLAQDRTTLPFRVYLHQVPMSLAVLLAKVLIPGNNIRHKLGYGKAYGYGSVSFTITGAHLRQEPRAAHIPGPLQDWGDTVKLWCATPWEPRQLAPYKLDTLIDWKALGDLARVLGWQRATELLFTYPVFARGGFATPVPFDTVQRIMANWLQLDQRTHVTGNQARTITRRLFDLKQPIHFQQYQELALGWSIIEERTP
jgi:hypothetical protein